MARDANAQLVEKDFDKLCEASDRVLREKDLGLATVCIPGLHIVRPHPFFNEQYLRYLKDSPAKTTWAKFFTKSWLQLIRLFKVSGLKKSTYFHIHDEDSKSKDVLFVTHLVNASQLERSTDQYFGDFHLKLQERGVSTAFVAIPHIDPDTSNSKNTNLNYILSKQLPFLVELKILLSIWVEHFKLRTLPTGDDRLESNIVAFATEDVLSPSTISQFRMYLQFKKLLRRVKPKVVVVTYEGHGFERLLFKAAYEVDKKIKRVGFQHAAVFLKQHSIGRSLGRQYDPDFVLTPGDYSRSQLSKFDGLRKTPIFVAGTPKFEVSKFGRLAMSDTLSNILVVPEYLDEECYFLFSFSISLAVSYPEMRFIWRLHPATSFEKLKKKYSVFQKLPENIIMSEISLGQDIERCQIVLYRGSSAAVSAVLNGLIPIYLKKKDEIEIDPIFELPHRRVVQDTDDFFHAHNTLINDLNSVEKELEENAQFCRKFYEPINVEKSFLRIPNIHSGSNLSKSLKEK